LRAVIRKQLDGVAEAAHQMFADVVEVKITFDKVGEGAGQQYMTSPTWRPMPKFSGARPEPLFFSFRAARA
jgi:hypothetical protein